jgi:hypothetical protein
MDLDDELKELFTSDRLDVHVRSDAEGIIVAGARRVRRNRIAAATASGVLGVVIAVVAGVMLAGGDPDAMPPATSTTTERPAASSLDLSTLPNPTSAAAPPLGSTTTTTLKPNTPPPTRTTVPGPPKLHYEVVGPVGLRSLELGQTLEQAQATGLMGHTTDGNGGCTVYEMISDDRIAGYVYMSDTVQAIAAYPVQTPQGVGQGWTVEQVKAEYPDLDEQAATETGHALVPVPGNAAAVFRLNFADGVVTGVTLQFADQPCY